MMGLLAGRRLSPPAADRLLAAGAYGLDLVISWDHPHQGQVPLWVVPVYAAVGYPALVLRRRFPLAVFGVMLVHSVFAALTIPVYFPAVGVWVALYTVAAERHLRDGLLALLAALVPAWLNVRYNVSLQKDADSRTTALISTAVVLTLLNAALFGVGRWVGWSSRRHARTEASATMAVAAERTRIARDLHDVIAHSVTLMLLQAAGASRMLQRDPDRAAAALGHVDDLGQEALVELRRMLDLLRLDTPSIGMESTSSPPTGLSGIAELVERAKASSAAVQLVLEGAARPVAPGVDLTGYRIAQEALTNAARYADPSHPIVVSMKWQQAQVVISIRNHMHVDRRAPTRAAGSGYGLLGMRERALSVTGRFTAGPQPDNTFLVEAVLPTRATGTESADGPASQAVGHG
jgi:signal transduction histidine kinase